MGYVTKEEVECKKCGRIIQKNELQYDSPEGRICVYCYTGKSTYEETKNLLEKIRVYERDLKYAKPLFVIGLSMTPFGLLLLYLTFSTGSIRNIADITSVFNGLLFGLFFTGLGFYCICSSIDVKFFYPSKLVRLTNDLRWLPNENTTRWLQGFIRKNKPDFSLQETTKEMFKFLKTHLQVDVSTPEILTLVLDQKAWTELLENWAWLRPLRLDDGSRPSLKESKRIWSSNILGVASQTVPLRELGFLYDYLIFINQPLLEIKAKRDLKSSYFQTKFKFLFEQTLMHEIIHVYERLLHKKFIKVGRLGKQDPFVVIAYETYLSQQD